MESSAYQDLIDRLNRIEQYVERTTHLQQDIDDELEMSTKDLIETLNVSEYLGCFRINLIPLA